MKASLLLCFLNVFLFIPLALSTGDRRCLALCDILEEAISPSGIYPEDTLDEVEAKLDPILDQYEDSPTYGKAIAGVLESSFGIDMGIVRGYMMRRQRRRVREWNQMLARGEVEKRRLNYGNIPTESDEARLRRLEKRIIRAQAAKEAEMHLLYNKMEKLHLDFESAPIEFAFHHEELRGKSTENQYARVFNALRMACGVIDDWFHKYKVIMKRRRRFICKGESLDGLWQLLRRKQHVNTSSGHDEKFIRVEGIEDDERWDHDDAEDVRSPMCTSSSTRLSRPLHDFQLPYSWNRQAMHPSISMDDHHPKREAPSVEDEDCYYDDSYFYEQNNASEEDGEERSFRDYLLQSPDDKMSYQQQPEDQSFPLSVKIPSDSNGRRWSGSGSCRPSQGQKSYSGGISIDAGISTHQKADNLRLKGISPE